MKRKQIDQQVVAVFGSAVLATRMILSPRALIMYALIRVIRSL